MHRQRRVRHNPGCDLRHLLTIGLNNIAAGKKAFINFGRNLLVEGLVWILPKESVVIEVLETTEPDADVVECCRKLQKLGYTIALDDFVGDPRFEALVATAKIIKVDIRATSREEQERLLATYQPRGIAMLAEKVETREEFELAANLGYDYFQGYFFARPEVLSEKELQPIVVNSLQVLRQLQNLEIDFKELENLIRKDVALTYKLFRYVNSALLSRGGDIQSIRTALVRLGEDGIRTVGDHRDVPSHSQTQTRRTGGLRHASSPIQRESSAGGRRFPLPIGLFDRLVLGARCAPRPAAPRSSQ